MTHTVFTDCQQRTESVVTLVSYLDFRCCLCSQFTCFKKREAEKMKLAYLPITMHVSCAHMKFS